MLKKHMESATAFNENPWKSIPLQDYEGHMGHDEVGQLQVLNHLVREQLYSYQPQKIVMLGIAGGNGLEHVDVNTTQVVYGYDLNLDYLEACQTRYEHLQKALILSDEDLSLEETVLPPVDLVIANLIIEYVGVSNFVALLNRSTLPKGCVVSCVIQKNGPQSFVGASEISSLDVLEDHHQTIDETKLIEEMNRGHFTVHKRDVLALKGGKQFIRLDFC